MCIRDSTTSIMHKPWAGQTEDHFDSMITRIKKIDGTWVYDYAVFDKWVEFMMIALYLLIGNEIR